MPVLPEPGTELHGSLIAPLSTASLRFIEEKRFDRALSFELRLIATLHETHGTKTKIRLEEFPASPVIARSDWVKLLSKMEWSELELFELSIAALRDDENLRTAFQLLRDAEALLREGRYKSVLAHCRQAFESAAKHESAGQVKKGFELLFERAFPESQNEEKRKALNHLIDALSAYAHLLGRHEQYPALHVSRDESEFGFRITLSLFSLLSRRFTRDAHQPD